MLITSQCFCLKFCSHFIKFWNSCYYFSSSYCCLYFLEMLFHLHDSCALCIHTILRSYWMNWDRHLSCWILENSQIAWILEVALLPLFFMWSIHHLIMCHQNSLVFLLLTRKFNWLFCKFHETKVYWSSKIIYSGVHWKKTLSSLHYGLFVILSCVVATFTSLSHAFSLFLRIFNTFVLILIFHILSIL